MKTVGQFARLVPDTLFELKDGFMKTFFKTSELEGIHEEKPLSSKDTRVRAYKLKIISDIKPLYLQT